MLSGQTLNLNRLQMGCNWLPRGSRLAGLERTDPKLQSERTMCCSCAGMNVFTIISLLQLELAFERIGTVAYDIFFRDCCPELEFMGIIFWHDCVCDLGYIF